MSGFDTPRLARLARNLRLPARQVLLVAARLAHRLDGDGTHASESTRRIARDARGGVGGAVAALLATPIADFAQDDVDRALSARRADDAGK